MCSIRHTNQPRSSKGPAVSLERQNVSHLPKATAMRCCSVPAAHETSSAAREGRGQKQTGSGCVEGERKGKDPGLERTCSERPKNTGLRGTQQQALISHQRALKHPRQETSAYLKPDIQSQRDLCLGP